RSETFSKRSVVSPACGSFSSTVGGVLLVGSGTKETFGGRTSRKLRLYPRGWPVGFFTTNWTACLVPSSACSGACFSRVMFGSPAADAAAGAINAIAATTPKRKRNPLFATESNGRIFRHISLIPLAPRKKFTSGVSGTKREDSLTVLIDFGY